MARLLNSGLRANPHAARRYRRADPPAPPVTQQDADGPEQDAQVDVPEGMTKVADLTKWVGDDPAKAQAVLDREATLPHDPRVTLVAAMEAVVAQDELI